MENNTYFNKGHALFWSQHAIPKYSRGPMTAHMKDMPKQPLPPLLESLEQYLQAVKPLITSEEYRRTEKIVREFSRKDAVGEKLYIFLKKQYLSLDNWIEDRWVRAEFQKHREPISPNNVASAYIHKIVFESSEQYLSFSSAFVYSILHFKRMIDCHQIKPDVMNGKPLDMSEYFLLFSTTQVPFKDCDRCIHYGDHINFPKHIIVARNNKFFQVNVFQDNGLPITKEELLHHFQHIVSQSDTGIPIGVLTTEHRETWANIHEILCEDEGNKHSIEMLQSAMFVLSLDKPVKCSVNSDTVNRNLCNFLHGCGPSINGCNRWFDCGLSIYITDDGIIGLNMGSTPLEAQPFQRMIEHAIIMTKKGLDKTINENQNDKIMPLSSTIQDNQNNHKLSSTIQEPKELQFNLSIQVLKDIEKAKLKFQKACDNVDVEILEFPNFGRKLLKAHNISVDSFVQMAYQLTSYRLHGNGGVVCSVATLHNFYRGHYDLIHSTTSESLEFCRTMLNEKCSEKEKYISLRKALRKHNDNINKALNGKGINYLLYGLKIAAEENDFEMPDIFKDKTFLKYFNIKLISSQIPGHLWLPVYFSYGPFSEDGYGCPYFVFPDKLHFSAFSYKHVSETNSKKFLKVLETSLLEMEKLIRTYWEIKDNSILKNHIKIP